MISALVFEIKLSVHCCGFTVFKMLYPTLWLPNDQSFALLLDANSHRTQVKFWLQSECFWSIDLSKETYAFPLCTSSFGMRNISTPELSNDLIFIKEQLRDTHLRHMNFWFRCKIFWLSLCEETIRSWFRLFFVYTSPFFSNALTQQLGLQITQNLHVILKPFMKAMSESGKTTKAVKN